MASECFLFRPRFGSLGPRFGFWFWFPAPAGKGNASRVRHVPSGAGTLRRHFPPFVFPFGLSNDMHSEFACILLGRPSGAPCWRPATRFSLVWNPRIATKQAVTIVGRPISALRLSNSTDHPPHFETREFALRAPPWENVLEFVFPSVAFRPLGARVFPIGTVLARIRQG